ncbi:hypothetical protein DVK85_11230 [Flavobacterium arcticum]|uniref:Uncharacterized protein n=1 Tax=Flavobacterium arcticum TaxID=1784713 RepID=A0A345HDW1_9FLAO|nr:hypothetical protein [Flavobacterium arcticum]AXG74771.1 hypothetical protein DVK85_11230 [Flavobacterium arcticum]KAF2509729.1 hypothetical protein E0W72_09445 [Flavobacterium arcticum]
MKQYTNAKKPTTLQSVANVPIQRKNRENSFHLIDNRPQTTIQRKLQQSNTLPIQFVKEGEAPKVSDIFGMARGFFGKQGSPQIAALHQQMQSSGHSLLSEPAGIMSGWQAGRHETSELAKFPPSDDYRDKIAKSLPASIFRPFAAAAAGGMLKSGHEHHRMMMTPDSYNPSRDPFNPNF